MKSDWVIWSGCTLLFCAGAVWGGVTLNMNFFKVANIHDLFEIFSCVATVAAVCLAFYSVNAWRKQVSAEADHNLAHRVAVAALKYKENSRAAFNDAQFAITQFKYGREGFPAALLESYVVNMEARLQKNLDARVDFLADLLEARAIWGHDFHKKYDELISLADSFNGAMRAFFHWSRLDPENVKLQIFSNILSRMYLDFERKNWLTITGEQVSYFDEVTLDADKILSAKLLRF